MKNSKITQYKNEVNTIPMREWTSDEMDLFFAILTRMKDENTKEVVMDRQELAFLSNYKRHFNEFKTAVSNLSKKIMNLYYIEKTSNSYLQMPLFTYFKLNWKDDLSDMALTIKVNPEFEYILNKWNEGNWTKFMLDEFTSIRSTYSKTLFRLLKQWKFNKNGKTFEIDEFRKFMCIPDSYSVGLIHERIVKKSVKDLQPYFKDLQYEAITENTKGKPITKFKFWWIPEERQQAPEFVDEKYIEKTNKQRVKNKTNHREPDDQTKEYIKKRKEEYYQSIIDERDNIIPENMSISDYMNELSKNNDHFKSIKL
ncbi:replication initiation protein [Anaerococcus sp. AGMB09787]|uniref:replication initiation protein n=1 Tax=Anaerococcus sp. AGMB09787 TaxID=2922869 RepID=UPI001FAE805B|nr:replication initiation protein [Anaerococcus sp. AGMB09787]